MRALHRLPATYYAALDGAGHSAAVTDYTVLGVVGVRVKVVVVLEVTVEVRVKEVLVEVRMKEVVVMVGVKEVVVEDL